MKNKFILVVLLVIFGGVLYSLFGKSVPPSKNCSGIPTPQQTEGPYYKTGSPQTNNIAQGIVGEKLKVMGFVFDRNCKPVANAWLDFWQADAKGVYDNSGYKLRGHQYSNHLGKYTLGTIVPGAYETRPPHIHVKVGAGNGPVLTSQLYFPNAGQKDLIMDIVDGEYGKIGTFNFVLQ